MVSMRNVCGIDEKYLWYRREMFVVSTRNVCGIDEKCLRYR